MRDTLFISHATPEDNNFTIWLASRLKLLGYEVWIDKDSLLGGEKTWEEIDQVIRNKAVKFLLVYSENICQKDLNNNPLFGKLKDGVYKEFSLGESISKNENLKDFIILLKIDKSDYNLFIGADRINQISFVENWANGFQILEKKLQKDKVIKSDRGDLNFGEWYENQYIVPNKIISRHELYYSNWWPIRLMPEFFYIFQYKSEEQAIMISKKSDQFPVAKISNNLISFESELDCEYSDINGTYIIKPQHIHKIEISKLLNDSIQNCFPSNKDFQKLFQPFVIPFLIHGFCLSDVIFFPCFIC